MLASFNVLPTQPQQQQHLLKPRTIGAKATSAVTEINNLSHRRLDLRCSYNGGCLVAPAQCQATNALHVALHFTSQQHSHSHATYLPVHTLVRAYLHYEDYTAMHMLYAQVYVHLYMPALIYA